jgi:serine/threonine protein kinase
VNKQAAPDLPIQPGDVIAGKYRIEKLLGAGGMGAVVAAMHTTLDEPVAIKFMLASRGDDEVAKKRFLREAKAISKLKNAHVTRVIDVGALESGELYIVMERLVGSDLDGVIRASGTLAPEETCEIGVQVCEALAEAHGCGILHRDIKPENIFVTRHVDGSPNIKVLDFGIAKYSDASLQATALTQSTALLGSPMYMSLEQFQSAHGVDARSDIWSLGVVLYKALTGTMPFQSDSIGGLIMALMTTEPDPVSNRRQEVPAGLNDVVMRCLSRQPEDRFQNVAELAAALVTFAPARAASSLARIRAYLSVRADAEAGPASKSELETADTVAAGPSESTSPPEIHVSRATTAKDSPAPLVKTSQTWSGSQNEAKPARNMSVFAMTLGALVIGVAGTAFFLRDGASKGANTSAAVPLQETANASASTSASTAITPIPTTSPETAHQEKPNPSTSIGPGVTAPSNPAAPPANSVVAKAALPVKTPATNSPSTNAAASAPAATSTPGLVPDFGGRK